MFIQFRAWDRELKAYLPNVQNHIGNSENAFGYMLKDGRYIIEQSIGLKGLYENDIISDNNGTGFIEYVEKYAAFRVNYQNGECKWFYHYLYSEYKTIEKIGNIHENPELLK